MWSSEARSVSTENVLQFRQRNSAVGVPAQPHGAVWPGGHTRTHAQSSEKTNKQTTEQKETNKQTNKPNRHANDALSTPSTAEYSRVATERLVLITQAVP